jgi:hypothetical protein
MTRDPKTGHYVADERKVVPITGPGPSAEDQAVTKLKELQGQAIQIRVAMDFCVQHISIDRLIMENLLIEAADAVHKRKACRWVDAREYVARRVAEGIAPVVESSTGDTNDTDKVKGVDP